MSMVRSVEIRIWNRPFGVTRRSNQTDLRVIFYVSKAMENRRYHCRLVVICLQYVD